MTAKLISVVFKELNNWQFHSSFDLFLEAQSNSYSLKTEMEVKNTTMRPAVDSWWPALHYSNRIISTFHPTKIPNPRPSILTHNPYPFWLWKQTSATQSCHLPPASKVPPLPSSLADNQVLLVAKCTELVCLTYSLTVTIIYGSKSPWVTDNHGKWICVDPPGIIFLAE